MSTASMNQSADSTACTRLLMVFNYYSWYCVNANQLPTTTFSTCTHVKIHAFNVPSIAIPWFYSPLLWTTETVQHTSAQSISIYSALILAGIRRPGETQVNNGEREKGN